LSAVVYAVATRVAAISWAARGGLDELSAARYMNVARLALMSVAV
jgi:hypothetical protein